MKRFILRLLITATMFLVAYNVYAPNIQKRLYDQRNSSLLSQFIVKQRLIERVECLAKVFRIVESSNRYHVKGQNGEYGAYQFGRDTWSYYCRMFFGMVLDITSPANQDLVAKAKIAHLIQKGYTNAQIAAIWNCGSSDYEGKVGVNSGGVKYDVPAYVKKFLRLVEKNK